jgi:hypothetical protein
MQYAAIAPAPITHAVSKGVSSSQSLARIAHSRGRIPHPKPNALLRVSLVEKELQFVQKIFGPGVGEKMKSAQPIETALPQYGHCKDLMRRQCLAP